MSNLELGVISPPNPFYPPATSLAGKVDPETVSKVKSALENAKIYEAKAPQHKLSIKSLRNLTFFGGIAVTVLGAGAAIAGLFGNDPNNKVYKDSVIAGVVLNLLLLCFAIPTAFIGCLYDKRKDKQANYEQKQYQAALLEQQNAQFEKFIQSLYKYHEATKKHKSEHELKNDIRTCLVRREDLPSETSQRHGVPEASQIIPSLLKHFPSSAPLRKSFEALVQEIQQDPESPHTNHWEDAEGNGHEITATEPSSIRNRKKLRQQWESVEDRLGLPISSLFIDGKKYLKYE